MARFYFKADERFPWYVNACDEHGSQLNARGFRISDLDFETLRPCPFCAGVLTLADADCCWCATRVSRCPVHGRRP